MKILITDMHAGCQMWQASILKKLGHEVVIYSFSGHRHLLKEEDQVCEISLPLTEKDRQHLSQFDTILVSFPPSFINWFLDLDLKYPKIVNCGHRLQISSSDDFSTLLAEQVKSKKIVLGSMSTYDSEYLKYYTGLVPYELYTTCFHVPSNIPYKPDRQEILIAPVHATSFTPFINIDHMNYLARFHNFNLSFSLIKDLYNNYKYEDLCRHPACVLFPYSVFSISMVELYELNIPMFVPSLKLLIETGIMKDVKLFPIYMTEQDTKKIDRPHEDYAFLPSPNSYDIKASEYWLKFSYFFTKQNVIFWDTPVDLFQKLTTTDLSSVSNRMNIETKNFREKQLCNWSTMLANLIGNTPL